MPPGPPRPRRPPLLGLRPTGRVRPRASAPASSPPLAWPPTVAAAGGPPGAGRRRNLRPRSQVAKVLHDLGAEPAELVAVEPRQLGQLGFTLGGELEQMAAGVLWID